MEKQILVFGAGRSSTFLIDYLKKYLRSENWQLYVADADLKLAQKKIGDEKNAHAISLNVNDDTLRAALIQKADIVISLLPPSLHFPVAKDCLSSGKNLLTASYVDDNISALSEAINNKGLLFLCEMGLDPGIDHMSAMKAIDAIKAKGGNIISFSSHCGGLVAPVSDNNPWHYKISWNSSNVVKAGSLGGDFRVDGKRIHQDYQDLFFNCAEVNIPALGNLAYYPNRDSLSYISVYHLESADSFLRTTLRHPDFCKGWHLIVNAGLTDDKTVIDTSRLTFREWSKTIKPFITDENYAQLEFLGVFSDSQVPATGRTSADILQFLLDTRLKLEEKDKDMVVMLHEIKYKIDYKEYTLKSSLIVEGIDNVHTAMAKTVGLPLGIAAKLILKEKITIKGLKIPVCSEIYEPVLAELKKEGIEFNDMVE